MKKKLLSLLSIAAMSIAFGQWTPQNTGVQSQVIIQNIAVKDAKTVWTTFGDASGQSVYPRYVAVTGDGGTTWKNKIATGVPSTALISDIYGKDANTAFIVTAPTGSAGAANGLWKTTNAGDSWTKVPGVFSNASFGNIIHFWDDNNGIVIGDPVNGKYEMYLTTNAGDSWTVLGTAPTQKNEDYGYVAGKVSYKNHLWLTSNTGRILHTADFGKTWDSYDAPIGDFSGEEEGGHMTFTDANNGILIARNGWFWFTENGGKDWDLKDDVTDYFDDIKLIPGTNTLISLGGFYKNDFENPAGSSYSTDGGNTWNVFDHEAKGAIGTFDCNNVWGGGASADGKAGIFKLTNPVPGCSTLGVTDQNIKKTELKAVVKDGVLNIVSNKDVKNVLVGDMSARTLTQANSKNVNVSNLKPGVYYARVAYADGAFGTVKFIIK